jgi:hypothetical protein
MRARCGRRATLLESASGVVLDREGERAASRYDADLVAAT